MSTKTRRTSRPTHAQPADRELMIHREYDARCAACWLNHTHTLSEHERNIADAAARRAAWREMLEQRLVRMPIGSVEHLGGTWAQRTRDGWHLGIAPAGVLFGAEAAAERIVADRERRT